MAVPVNISGRKHLSFSPLNDKHNILYSGARNSFNQRYKQKPWFRLNPFTDKGVGKGETIDRYDPDHDAGLSLLQSVVIVEDYFSDTPQLVKEFTISEFWDFLFSDSWSSGHNVRVFEGQLLDMIFSCLLSLTNSRKLVQHDTKAFAKNQRQKNSMIKQETKTGQDCIPFTETLLLKFTYYGHVVKPACFDPESSMGYPDITTTATNSSWFPEAADIDSIGETSSTLCLKTSDTKSPFPPPTEAKYRTQHPRKRRVRASGEALLQIENERMMISRFMSNNDSIIPNPPIPRGNNYRYTCSNFSNASDDYKSLPPKVDLNNFICTEKASYVSEKAMYLGEFKLPPEDCSSASEREDDDDEDFGQHFYLGDNDEQEKEEVVESVVTKLKKRKEMLQQDRDNKKQLTAKQKPRDNKIMPEFSELDIKKYVGEHEVEQIIPVPANETVPTFEEYAETLDDDLKRETKVRVRKMVSTIVKKSGISTGKIGGMLFQAGFKGGSNVKSSAQRMLIFEQLMKVKKKKQEMIKRTNKIVVPIVYISMPSGLTFLHPLSRPLLQKKMVEEQKRQEAIKPKNTKRRMSLLPTSGTALSNELTKVRLSSKINQSKQGPKFPKIKLVPSNESIESSDEHDSEEEVEDLDKDIVFDSKKLNIKYSRNRMKKAKAARRAEEKKNMGHIYNLLKKYCRMQSIFKAFGGPTKKRRRSSIASLPLSNRRKKKMDEISDISENEVATQDTYVDVGKLKKFAFLEEKEKAKTTNSEQMKSLFNNYPMELFCENLERSLKDFVVRREIVTSDYNGKTLVSITFTKKSVFTSNKFPFDQ